MGDHRHLAVFSRMGTGQGNRRGVGTRIRRGKHSPAGAGGFDAAVLVVSEQRGSDHRRHEKGRMDYSEPRKRFSRATDGAGASQVMVSPAAHG